MKVLNNAKISITILNNRKQGLRIKSKLVGSSGTQLVVYDPTNQDTLPLQSELDFLDVRLEGDCSEYYGTFTVKTNAIGGVVSFPGTLVAEGGAIIRPVSTTTTAIIKNGTIGPNVTLEFPCDPANGTAGSMKFSDKCTIGAHCTIRPEGTFRPMAGSVYRVTLLSVPDDGVSTAITPEMFTYDYSLGTHLKKYACAFTVEKSDGFAHLVMTAHQHGMGLIFR